MTTKSSLPTVLMADGDLVRRGGLAAHLRNSGECSVVECGSGAEAVAAAGGGGVDAVLVDVRVPEDGEPGAVRKLCGAAPVVLLAFVSDAGLGREGLADGALALLEYGAFTPPELAEVVRTVARPDRGPATRDGVEAVVERRAPAASAALRADGGLTAREAQVLRLVAGGMSNAMIADHLLVAEKTVKNHINHIYAKLHLKNRGKAVDRWHAACGASV